MLMGRRRRRREMLRVKYLSNCYRSSLFDKLLHSDCLSRGRSLKHLCNSCPNFHKDIRSFSLENFFHTTILETPQNFYTTCKLYLTYYMMNDNQSEERLYAQLEALGNQFEQAVPSVSSHRYPLLQSKVQGGSVSRASIISTCY